MATLYLDNDNLITLDGLYDSHPLTDAYINDATVTCTLLDPDGNAVAGASGLSMTYIPSSNGKYVGVLEDGLSLTRSAEYTARVDVDAGGDKIAEFNLDLVAYDRGAT